MPGDYVREANGCTNKVIGLMHFLGQYDYAI